MKKVFIVVFGLAMTMGFSQYANAWGWKKVSVECKAKLITVFGNDDELAKVTFEESWEGYKNVCRDGESWWCWSSDCS